MCHSAQDDSAFQRLQRACTAHHKNNINKNDKLLAQQNSLLFMHSKTKNSPHQFQWIAVGTIGDDGDHVLRLVVRVPSLVPGQNLDHIMVDSNAQDLQPPQNLAIQMTAQVRRIEGYSFNKVRRHEGQRLRKNVPPLVEQRQNDSMIQFSNPN